MIEIVGVDFLKFVNFSQSDDFDIYEMGRYASVPNYSYRRASSEHIMRPMPKNPGNICGFIWGVRSCLLS